MGARKLARSLSTLLGLNVLCLAACDEDIVCIKIGDSVTATYTEEDGTVHSEVVLIGDQGTELGRCGSDVYSTGWTLDCLNHDMCQMYMIKHGIPENPGGLGPNCLDEFNEAVDDYSHFLPECDGA
jgi:hypothetical protein